MKLIRKILIVLAVGYGVCLHAQEDKLSYYEERAKADAKFEQEFQADTPEEEEKFWTEQQAYERELKQRDRKAYRAYLRGKRDAYEEHYEHCHGHHHTEHYYHHASFYYYNSHRHPRYTNGVRAGLRLNAPSIRLGLF